MTTTTSEAELIIGLDLCDEPVTPRARATEASAPRARRYCGRDAVAATVTSANTVRYLCTRHARVASVFASAIAFDGESF